MMKHDAKQDDLMNRDTGKKLVVRKDETLFDLLDMGLLFSTVYDTETTDLDKRFAEITQFGGCITDLAGNILHKVDYRAKISPHTVISPMAWVVQRMRLDDLQRGDPKAIFMGKVMKFFEYSSSLDKAPYIEKFLEGCREGVYKDAENRKEKKYYAYPVQNEDGSTDWDFIRIHENLRKFYFKNKSGQWVKRDIKSLSVGYNNVNADDQWLWTAAHMSGAENIFMTHLAQMGKLRFDALRAVESAFVIGSAGENGLKAMEKENPLTGEKYLSFSQGSILEVNTRHSSELRDIVEGIVDEDGAHIDLSQLHGALSDSLALLALVRYIRKVHPNVFRQMVKNSDWKYVVNKMSEIYGEFGNNPPLAYVDKCFPVVDGKMVSLIGTDQFRNAPKVAVVWNLNIDPSTYTHNEKKSIKKMTAVDWKQILIDASHNPNSPLKVIRAHKSPRLFDAEVGYRAGFNLDMNRQEIHRRISFVRDAKISDAVMEGLRLAFPRLHGVDRIVLPQPEEELFTFSTLELFDAAAGEDVQVHFRVKNKVEEIAQKSRQNIMQIKSLWMKAIQFDEDILLGFAENPDAMLGKIEELNKKLGKKGGVRIPQPDGPVTDFDSAMAYKIKILYIARFHFSRGDIKDIGHHFWFEDKDGIRYSDQEIMGWPMDKIDDARKSGNLIIRHEVANTMPLVLDRMIESLGYGHILGEQAQIQLRAYTTLRQRGMPHHHGHEDRWYTKGRGQRDLSKLKNNEMTREDLKGIEKYIPGGWEDFIEHQHDSLASLSEYEEYLKSIQPEEFTPELLYWAGVDPDIGYPIRNHNFAVDRERSVVVDVPDRYLQSPVIEPVTGRNLWILPCSEHFNKASMIHDKDLLFRAEKSGRIYHLPNAKMVDVPKSGGLHEDFYRQVETAYLATGFNIPSFKDRIAVIGSGPYPLFDLRQPNQKAQSLNVETHVFEGLVSPELAGYKYPISGVILRDDHLKISDGAIRIREQADGQSTGWEFETEVLQAKYITLKDVESFTEEEVLSFGFLTHEQAIDYFSALFSKQKKDPRKLENKALAISFAEVNAFDVQKGMMYFKPDSQVQSCVAKNFVNNLC